jgi:hypothetical protein
MAMTDLIPWKKSNDSLAVRQEQTDPFMRLRHNIDQVFDNMLGDWTGRMNKFDRALYRQSTCMRPRRKSA